MTKIVTKEEIEAKIIEKYDQKMRSACNPVDCAFLQRERDYDLDQLDKVEGEYIEPYFEFGHRVDGRALCWTCEKPYNQHPAHDEYDYLRVLCDGSVVKT